MTPMLPVRPPTRPTSIRFRAGPATRPGGPRCHRADGASETHTHRTRIVDAALAAALPLPAARDVPQVAELVLRQAAAELDRFIGPDRDLFEAWLLERADRIALSRDA